MKVKTYASKTTDYNTIRKENINEIELNNDIKEEEEKLIEKPNNTKNENNNINNNKNKNEIIEKNNEKEINNIKNTENNNEINDNNIIENQPQIQATPIQPGFKLNQNLEEKQIEFIKQILTSNNFMEEFDMETLTEFAIGFFSIEFDEGKIIFEENDEAKLFYIIEDGSVELISEKNNTDKILKNGDFFGIECFEEFSYRIQTAQVIKNSKLLCCSGEFYRNAQNYMLRKTINEKMEILKYVPLFKYIDNTKLSSISNIIVPEIYCTNSIIINENEPVERIYIIKEGIVRVTRKFKKIRKLEKNDYFGHIGLIMKIPSYYTYSVESNEVIMYEIPFKIIKGLGIKDMLYNLFLNTIQKSENMSKIFIQNYDYFFNIFKLRYYEANDIVFVKDVLKNKKICIIISGTLRQENKNEILAKNEMIFGDSIIDKKENLEQNIISEEESLILEASWEEIVKAGENDRNNNLDLCETVENLKRVQILSNLKETQFLELAKVVNKEVYQDSDLISKEGEIASKYFIIKSGKVRMYQKKKFIRELEEGNCFGEIPGITGEIRLFSVVSYGNTECYIINKEDFGLLNSSLINQIKNLYYLNDVNIVLSDLFFVKILGNGKFGKVFLVHNQKHFYAIKFAKIKNILMNKNLMRYYYNEKKIMLQIDHPFILKLVKTLKNNEYLFFLLEYIDGITLKTYIEKRKKNLTKNTNITAFYGAILLIVINYLHNKRIIHRDIKPDNCMLDKNGYLKLIDFGVSKELKDIDSTNTICGTPHYLAPEIIIGKGYSYSADYWSLGITMFELFYGYVPFGQGSKETMDIYYEILNKKLSLPYDPKFNDINSFFKIILSKNLMHRVCNFQLLRSHPFFHEFDFDQLLNYNVKAPYIPDSYIDTSANNNVSMISICNMSISQYMNSIAGYEFENISYEEEYLKEKKFIDDF